MTAALKLRGFSLRANPKCWLDHPVTTPLPGNRRLERAHALLSFEGFNQVARMGRSIDEQPEKELMAQVDTRWTKHRSKQE
jgi:hypothetical protein